MYIRKLFPFSCHTEKPQVPAERKYCFLPVWKSSCKKLVRHQILSLNQLLKSLLQQELENLLYNNLLLCDLHAFGRGRITQVYTFSGAHCSKGSREAEDVANQQQMRQDTLHLTWCKHKRPNTGEFKITPVVLPIKVVFFPRQGWITASLYLLVTSDGDQ